MYKLPFLRSGEIRAALSYREAAALRPQTIALPAAAALNDLARGWHALGPVLWLWRAAAGRAADLSAVAGWNCVHRIEPDGICEALRFYRADGREQARLYLLPDSDYLAWEQLLQRVPCSSPEPQRGLHQRLREAAWSRAGHPWQGAVVKFCTRTDPGRPWLSAETSPQISATGWRRAQDICAGLDAVLQR